MSRRLWRSLSIHLSFGLAIALPRQRILRVSWAPNPRRSRANTHHLQYGVLDILQTHRVIESDSSKKVKGVARALARLANNQQVKDQSFCAIPVTRLILGGSWVTYKLKLPIFYIINLII